MVDADTLRILAAISSVAGSVLLAWRVKGILEALSLVAQAHEANIAQLMRPGGNIVHFGNSTAHVERAKGMWLLVIGFLLLGVSGGLNLWALTL